MPPAEPPPQNLVVTDDGSWTLQHAEHGEAYHSRHGALSEAELLYVRASGIVTRFLAPQAVHVLDVGLGLGYNAIATIEAWLRSPAPGDLLITSLEVDATLAAALASGTGAWQGNWSDARRALARALGRSPVPHPSGNAQCRWQLHLGDAAAAPLPAAVDYVWQDPFSPTKNPEMWSQAWFERLYAVAAPGCVLQTYSVARAVRDALTGAGWTVEKIPTGTGGKRHWLRARR